MNLQTLTFRMPIKNTAMAVALWAVCNLTTIAEDEERGLGPGHGHIQLTYQYIRVDGFDSTVGELDIGTTDTHTLNIEASYTFNNRWTVYAGLPIVRKRYSGVFIHDTPSIMPPVDDEFIDDGEFRTEFQDLHFGASYSFQRGNFLIEPFAGLGVPTNDYPHFGHAAVGQNLLRSNLGSKLTFVPPFGNYYFHGSLGYEFVEETLGVDISHWRLDGEFGYHFSPKVSAKVFFLGKRGGGLKFPDDFPTPRNTLFWFQHDRLVRHNYHNVGAGVDWQVGENYQLSFSALTMTHSEQVHVVDYAFTMGVGWAF